LGGENADLDGFPVISNWFLFIIQFLKKNSILLSDGWQHLKELVRFGLAFVASAASTTTPSPPTTLGGAV